jgi:hypothetical protein
MVGMPRRRRPTLLAQQALFYPKQRLDQKYQEFMTDTFSSL